MLIGELSQRTGTPTRLLRYYEDQDLIRPHRRPGGFREYAEADVRTVRCIRTLLAAGIGTLTIAELLPFLLGDARIEESGCPELLPELYQVHRRVSDAVANLLAARDVLDSVIAAARSLNEAAPGADRSAGPGAA
ncbi:MerR family transcriptional regulator [Streptomyces anthocyanicus]|uniref:MerR family transcriptional regulator n=1 Tax=Streptomyces anthocyanicus TaxID=68174 RepID=UPI00178134F7|nr:MerR family transcriptional regulator [Streptomyces anthocyanicus]WTC46284.1 MerR family transcriptional regulator [Streptomyces anthocyanicus]GHA55486.1 MerR family transcriptional regulator [Streptomyces anthocyanicus]